MYERRLGRDPCRVEDQVDLEKTPSEELPHREGIDPLRFSSRDHNRNLLVTRIH